MPGNDLISIDPDILVNIRFIRGQSFAIDSLCGINILLCCVEQKPSGILGQCTVQSTQGHRLWTGDDASVRVDRDGLDDRYLQMTVQHLKKSSS